MAKKIATATKKTAAAAKVAGTTQVSAKGQGNGGVTREQIAARAYEIYCGRCRTRQPGDAAGDWMRAEAELRAAVAQRPG